MRTSALLQCSTFLALWASWGCSSVQPVAPDFGIDRIAEETASYDLLAQTPRIIHEADVSVSILTGTSRKSGFANGDAKIARFDNPLGIVVGKDGALLVADSGNNRIRKVDPNTGKVSTFAGDGKDGGILNTRNGTDIFSSLPAGVGHFRNPYALASDAQGVLIVADTGHDALRQVGLDSIVTLLARGEFFAPRFTRTESKYRSPLSVAKDSKGKVYYAGRSAICRLGTNGRVSIIAGRTYGSGSSYQAFSTLAAPLPYFAEVIDGAGDKAVLGAIFGLAVDSQDNLIFTDSFSNCIRKVTFDAAGKGVVTTIAGRAQKVGVALNFGKSDAQGGATATVCLGGYADGPQAEAKFYRPCGIALDPTGTIYVSDTGNHCIRKIKDGKVTTLAGTGKAANLHAPGPIGVLPGETAKFNKPFGIALASSGRLYVVDSSTHCIHVVVQKP